MKGYRFYEDAGGGICVPPSILAVPLDDNGKPWDNGPRTVMAYDRDGGATMSTAYFTLYCRRISERKARELSPALFQELEKE